VRVEVFSGSVQIAAPSQTVKLGKDKVLEFSPEAMELASNETQGIVKDSWDKWTSGRDTQEQLSLTDQAVGPRGSLYGWGDLGAYGEWGFFPGFGYGWSPFASAGWSPYSMGMWSWYPGMGYAWISGEPWGWMPYHYGNWDFSPGFGWFWMPGTSLSFSPALVSWYSGAGWIGWAPQGAVGRAGQSIVTTVPGTVVQNGLMVGPQNANHVPATAGTMITRMPFQPGAGAMLPGPVLSASAETMFTPRAGATRLAAPPSILMGGDALREKSLQAGHAFNQPLRARLGTTLGGSYAVGGAVGEFRGDAFRGTHGATGVNGSQGAGFYGSAGAGGPTLLSHGQQSSNSPPIGGGGMTPSGGGGGSVRGGNAGGAMPTTGGAGAGAGAGHGAGLGGGRH
jgi:hypothetical protein